MVTTNKVELPPFFVPTIAQFDLIKQMQKPKDKFHTFRTRSDANLRERIRIDSELIEAQMIGDVNFKAPSRFATDIDESYRDELYHERSRSNFHFRPRTEMAKIRETFRKKMDVCWMREKLILDEADLAKQEKVIDEAFEKMNEYDSFSSKLKEESYHESIKALEKVRIVYQETDMLRKRFEELENSILPLKMKIYSSGINFVQLTILQKFQLLLKPIDWRLKFDHMHRTADGKLQGIKESISTRETANLWDRDNVTAYTIKDFILNEYANGPKPFRVFENAEKMVAAIRELQSKSYRSLVKFHFLVHSLAGNEKEFIQLAQQNEASILKLTEGTKHLNKRRLFIESRAKEIESLARKIAEKPLEESFASDQLRNLRGNCETIFQSAVLKKNNSSMTKYFTSIDKLAGVEKKVFELLEQLDRIPKNVIDETERKVRTERKRKLLIAHRAHKIELNLKKRITKLRRCLQKPPKNEKRVGKLPMSILPKRPAKVIVEKPLLTTVEEEYIRAFTGNDLGFGAGEIKFDENAKMMVDRIKNESIPFYVDHLLDKLGFKLTTLSKDNTEKIILEEMEHFKYEEFMPEVRRQVDLWLKHSEDEKKQNIDKTEYLYK